MESTIFQDISQQISSTMFKALSEQIGLPESLQSNLALAIEDNPWNLGLFKLLVQNPNGSPRDSGYGHHGGGCSDGFSIFGFLAFLLAAANLFMMDERKKRDINTEQGIIKYARFSCLFAQFSSIIFPCKWCTDLFPFCPLY